MTGNVALFRRDIFDKALLLCEGSDPDQVAIGHCLLFTSPLVLTCSFSRRSRKIYKRRGHDKKVALGVLGKASSFV